MSDLTPGTDPVEPRGALLERMSAAVTDVQPDVSALIDGGLSAGRTQVRRRRRQGWVAAVAVVAAVAAGSTYLGTSDLRSDRRGPTHVGQTEPATPRGLAAAVLAHTNDLGDPMMIGGWELTESEQPGGGLAVDLAFGTAGEGGVELQVVASADVASVRGPLCEAVAAGQQCQASTLDDGTRVALFTQSAPATGDSPASTFTGYLAVDDSQFIAVVQTAVGDSVAPLTADELRAIATDPMVGLSTGADFNAEGLGIKDFKKSADSFVVEGHDSGSSSGGGTSGPEGSAATASVQAPTP